MRARALLSAVLLMSCGLPLSELAPFPCAKDNGCPDGFQCMLGSCQPACNDGNLCPDGERCTDTNVCMPRCDTAPCAVGVCTRG